jgi:uncharacterized protein YbjT (DUF2867 family)
VTDRRLRGAAILVTGGTGLIGRHLLQALADCGVDPFAVVRPRRSRSSGAPHEPIVWDLTEADSRSRLPMRLDGVVHLAAPGTAGRLEAHRWRRTFAFRLTPRRGVFDEAQARRRVESGVCLVDRGDRPRDVRPGRSKAIASLRETKRWARNWRSPCARSCAA